MGLGEAKGKIKGAVPVHNKNVPVGGGLKKGGPHRGVWQAEKKDRT